MKRLTTTKEQIEENKNRKSGLQRHGIVKSLSLFLCIALLLATLAACGNGEENGSGTADDPTETSDGTLFGSGDNDDSSGEESVNDTADSSRDYSARLAANLEESMTTFDRDAVMISVGDQHITWGELYVFIFSTVANLTAFFETPVAWSDEAINERTVAEMMLEMATENALAFLSYRYGAAELGTSLSQEELEDLNFNLQSIIDMNGGPEEFLVVLRENHGFYDFEVFFEIVMMTESLVEAIMRDLYGDFGMNLPDEVVTEFAQSHEFMMAKHILVMSADNENARDEIDEIYNRLRPRANDADFENFFSLMMLEYSEDPGSLANPEGYLFQPWDMVEPFSIATMQLLPGEMSDVVETSHGYHIILRIPINPDAVPISLRGQGIMNTIRQLAAALDFELLATQWREQMNPEFSELYNSIDLANVFAWLEE